MYRSRYYNKVLTVILIIVILVVVGLLTYLIVNNIVNKKNHVTDPKDYVESEFLQQIVGEETTSNVTDSNDTTNESNEINLSVEESNETNINSSSNSSTSTKTKKVQYAGFDVIGTIEISKTGVSLPVLSKVTKKSLEASVAAIWPQPEAVLNSVGNVVIVGHNFRDGTFFSNNKKLSKGDEIKITDLEGTKITYEIYNIFETTDTDTSFYNRETDGKREITLSTCTDDGSARLIIEAREK